jgi:hypothetical protein
MDYFAIFEKKGRCAPLSLCEGILHSELNRKSPFEPLKSDSGEWRNAMNKRVELPNMLWFVTEDKCYTFDIRWDSGGFFISELMLNLFQKYKTIDYVKTKITILNKKLESVTDKNYYYVKFYNYTDVIDYSKSKIEFRKQGDLKKPWELILNTEISYDVFMIDITFFYNRLFCNNNFKKKRIFAENIFINN